MSQHYLPKCLPIAHPCSFTHIPENVKRDMDAEETRREMYTGLHGSDGYRVNIARAVEKNPIARQNDSSQVFGIMDMNANLTKDRGVNLKGSSAVNIQNSTTHVNKSHYNTSSTNHHSNNVYDKIASLQVQLHDLQMQQQHHAKPCNMVSFQPDICQPIPSQQIQYQQQPVYGEPHVQFQQQPVVYENAWEDDAYLNTEECLNIPTTTNSGIPMYVSHTNEPVDAGRRPKSATAWPASSKKKKQEKTKPIVIDEENVWQTSSGLANQKVLSQLTKQNASLTQEQQQNMISRLYPEQQQTVQRPQSARLVKKDTKKEPFRPAGKKNPGIPKHSATQRSSSNHKNSTPRVIQHEVPMYVETHPHSVNPNNSNIACEPTNLFPHMCGGIVTNSAVIDPYTLQHALAVQPPAASTHITQGALNKQRNAGSVYSMLFQQQPNHEQHFTANCTPVIPHINMPAQTSGTQLATSRMTNDAVYNENRARNMRSSAMDVIPIEEAPLKVKKTFVHSDSVYAQTIGNPSYTAPASSRGQHELLLKNRSHNNSSHAFDFATYNAPAPIQEMIHPTTHCEPIHQGELQNYNAITERSANEGLALSNRYRTRNQSSDDIQALFQQQKNVKPHASLNSRGALKSVDIGSAVNQPKVSIHSDANIVNAFLMNQTPVKRVNTGELKQQQQQSTFNPMYQVNTMSYHENQQEDMKHRLGRRLVYTEQGKQVDTQVQQHGSHLHQQTQAQYSDNQNYNPHKELPVCKPLVHMIPTQSHAPHTKSQVSTSIPSYYSRNNEAKPNVHQHIGTNVAMSVHSDIAVEDLKPQSSATLDVQERRKRKEKLKRGFEDQHFEFLEVVTRPEPTKPTHNETWSQQQSLYPRKCEAWSIPLEEMPVEHTVEVNFDVQNTEKQTQYAQSMASIKEMDEHYRNIELDIQVNIGNNDNNSNNIYNENYGNHENNDEEDDIIEEFVDLNSLLDNVEQYIE